MKLSKRKNLLGFIYALVMLLPFSAILVRCLYVTFNKNANQSYSQSILQQNVKITASSQLVEGVNYNISYKADVTSTTLININYISLTKEQLNISQASYDTINSIAFYTNNAMEIRFNGGYASYSWRRGTSFNIITTSNSGYNTLLSFAYVTQTTLVNDTLDNAFDYSLRTFIDENGTGVLNLTDWFTDVFLNRTTHNMLYLNYINWYMNYSLLVSCVYLLYSVLMWFLTFARYLINKPLKENE